MGRKKNIKKKKRKRNRKERKKERRKRKRKRKSKSKREKKKNQTLKCTSRRETTIYNFRPGFSRVKRIDRIGI